LKNKYYTLREYSHLGISNYNKTESIDSNLFVPKITFNQIKKFVLENSIQENGDSITNMLIPGYNKRDGEILKAQNYVGLIETKNRTVIEILPKIHQTKEKDRTKEIFLRMLKSLKNTPFKYLDQSHIKTKKMPLFEIFISMFLKELSIVIKRGLKKDYISKEENSFFLKGKLLFNIHIKKNIIHKDRFFVRYDEFLQNRPENRIIKATLKYLGQKSRNNLNKKKILNYMYSFSEVDECLNIEKDFSNCKIDRLMKDYYLVIKWCRVFLKNESFTNFKGENIAYALMFPMEKLFEDYIGKLVKKYCSKEFNVSLQDRRNHLLIEEKKFALIPDIVLRSLSTDETIIMDTKWKLLDESDSKSNYGISQADLYQMYAYAKKYKAKKIVLIYPANENFTKPIETIKKYEADIKISVIPVDLSHENEEDIIKLLGKGA